MATQIISVKERGNDEILFQQEYKYRTIAIACENSYDLIDSIFEAGIRWGGNFGNSRHLILWGPQYELTLAVIR